AILDKQKLALKLLNAYRKTAVCALYFFKPFLCCTDLKRLLIDGRALMTASGGNHRRDCEKEVDESVMITSSFVDFRTGIQTGLLDIGRVFCEGLYTIYMC